VLSFSAVTKDSDFLEVVLFDLYLEHITSPLLWMLRHVHCAIVVPFRRALAAAAVTN